MRSMWFLAAALLALASVGATAEEQGAKQPSAPAVPSASGSTSSQLSRSGGVITPPANVDLGMKKSPPPSGDTMPVVPPPGTPGGNPSVKPK
jgi:hypothetical protein